MRLYRLDWSYTTATVPKLPDDDYKRRQMGRFIKLRITSKNNQPRKSLKKSKIQLYFSLFTGTYTGQKS